MDIKDRKIIYELDKDSRTTYSQIAKKTRLTQETARYRINNMVKEGIIKEYLAVINTTKLGNLYYQLMLKLQNVNESKKSEMINFLKENRKVAWIGDLEGNYDISFIFYVKNQIELQNLINDLYGKYSQYIMKKNLSVNLYAEFFPRDYLVGKERANIQKTTYKSHEQFISLDKVDTEICKMLGKNGRVSSVDIGVRLSLSADAILQRIKKLRKEEIIQGFSLVIDPKKIGQSHYKILIYLSNMSKFQEERLVSHMRINNRVIAIIKKLAEWDYEVDIEVENVEQLQAFTMDLTNKFSDIIRDYDLVRIVNMPKYTFFP